MSGFSAGAGRSGVALLALFAGLTITAALFSSVHHHERNRELLHFKQQILPRVQTLEQGADDMVHELQSLGPLFSAPGQVSSQQFQAFATPLLARHPYIHTVSFQRSVAGRQRDEYEQLMRAHVAGFTVTEILDGERIRAPARQSYQVIEHAAPGWRAPSLVGLDASSRFSLEDALVRAGSTGAAAATNTYRLRENGDTWPGFVLLMPVYEYGMSVSTESKGQRTIGHTAALVHAPAFIEHLLRLAGLLDSLPLDVSVYEGRTANEEALLYRTGAAPRASAYLPLSLFQYVPEQVARTVDIGGNPWHFVVTPQPLPFTHYLGSVLALTGGLLSSVMVAGYMLILLRRNRRVQELVEQRTDELKAANQLLARDIEERKQAEQALRHAKHILTRSQEVGHLGSWEYDGRARRMYFSDEYYRICGLEPGSIEPSVELAIQVTHPDDREAAILAIRRCQTKGQNYKIEKRIRRPDGSVRYVISQGEVLFEGDELVAVVGCTLDITEQKQTEIALRVSQEQLRQLAAHQERIREDERKRVAREVHDELGGVLAGIKAYLSVAMEQNNGSSAKLLAQAANLADDACETVRRVITDLRPSVLDQLGIWEAIRWYLEQFGKRTNMICECWIEEHTATMELDDEYSMVVFRIVQEALTNVARHANASRVQVRAVQHESGVLVEVKDDGVGLDDSAERSENSWGIVGMHERARFLGGEFKIHSYQKRGTIATLWLPLVPPRQITAEQNPDPDPEKDKPALPVD